MLNKSGESAIKINKYFKSGEKKTNKKSGASGHPCLIHDVRENAFSLSP